MKKKVLIIDDSKPIRILLEAILSRHYAVTAVGDGLDAMAWLSAGNTADLIVTDLRMPNIDGWELLEHLSGSYLYKDIPVLVLSGEIANAAPETLMARYTNVQAVMHKPFDPVLLLEKIACMLNGQLTETLS
jgi:two-component system chemotaxis response regulator CheY